MVGYLSLARPFLYNSGNCRNNLFCAEPWRWLFTGGWLFNMFGYSLEVVIHCCFGYSLLVGYSLLFCYSLVVIIHWWLLFTVKWLFTGDCYSLVWLFTGGCYTVLFGYLRWFIIQWWSVIYWWFVIYCCLVIYFLLVIHCWSVILVGLVYYFCCMHGYLMFVVC